MADALACKLRGNNKAKDKWYHSKSSTVTWQEYQSAQGHRMKRDMGQVKEEKAHTQAMPSPKKGWDAKNESPKTHSRRKS